jgi:hypothetical protein
MNRLMAHKAWDLIVDLDPPYRRGAVEAWWELCERVLRAEHPELMENSK